MTRDVSITDAVLDEAKLRQERIVTSKTGAVVTFLGIVRPTENDIPIAALDYEAFEPMARRQFDLILNQIANKWPIEAIQVVHRIGKVAAGEPSLWVEVRASHRKEAFAACQFLIDEMKQFVPIWKRAITK